MLTKKLAIPKPSWKVVIKIQCTRQYQFICRCTNPYIINSKWNRFPSFNLKNSECSWDINLLVNLFVTWFYRNFCVSWKQPLTTTTTTMTKTNRFRMGYVNVYYYVLLKLIRKKKSNISNVVHLFWMMNIASKLFHM